ncbi:hypothetical protein KR222_009633, partial [Zaprionus bogoriensis]
MSLSAHLNNVVQQLVIKDEDRAPYTSDAQKICNELMEDLQKADAHFRQAFNGLSLTGNYLDRVKLKTPDEFDMHIKLKFPFQVTPERDYQRDGFVFLSVPYGTRHPAVKGSYIDRGEMQSWLRDAFKSVFRSYTRLSVNNRKYDLEYEQCGYGCAHTIVAKSPSRCISFDFVPVFEYTSDQWPLPAPPVSSAVRSAYSWFAVPQQKAPRDERTFMVCAPHWEREMLSGKQNLKNVLRLMKAMRDVQEMNHLSSYMLKTVILLELESTPNSYWHQDLATLLLAMWGKLAKRLQQRNLPFYLAKGCNHLDRLSKPGELDEFISTAAKLQSKL